jgi:hypothetical protein
MLLPRGKHINIDLSNVNRKVGLIFRLNKNNGNKLISVARNQKSYQNYKKHQEQS